MFLIAIAYTLLSQMSMEPVAVLVPKGMAIGTSGKDLQSSDFLFSERGRVFVIRSDQMAATEIDSTETVRWTREFPTVLTSASAGKELSAWGLLDGRLIILDANGALIPDNPDLTAAGLTDMTDACIYGVGISSDGDSLIVLYGREPQYLVALRREGSGFKVKSTLKLNESVLTSSQVVFSTDDSSALARTGDGLIFFNTGRMKFSSVFPEQTTRDLRIFARDEDAYTVLLSGDNGLSAIVIRTNLTIAKLPVEKVVKELGLRGKILSLETDGQDSILELDRR